MYSTYRKLIQFQKCKMSSGGKNKQKGQQKMLKESAKKPIDVQDKESPIAIDKTGNILIKFHAKPGAKQNSITDITSECVGIQISAPPIDGAANTELIKYLSSLFGIRKSDISLDKGSKSREKTILISKDLITFDRIMEILKAECQR